MRILFDVLSYSQFSKMQTRRDIIKNLLIYEALHCHMYVYMYICINMKHINTLFLYVSPFYNLLLFIRLICTSTDEYCKFLENYIIEIPLKHVELLFFTIVPRGRKCAAICSTFYCMQFNNISSLAWETNLFCRKLKVYHKHVEYVTC